jgi:hypothetical protein
MMGPVPVLGGEVVQQVFVVRLQLSVSPHKNEGPMQAPLPSQ